MTFLFTCSPTFGETFSLVNTEGFIEKLRLSYLKRKRRKNLNNRVNEETDSRRVEEEGNNLRRDIKESSLERGMERKEGGRG